MTDLNALIKFSSLSLSIDNMDEQLIFDFAETENNLDSLIEKIATIVLVDFKEVSSDEKLAYLLADQVKEKVCQALSFEFIKQASPEKYKHINFKPTDAMVSAAKRGLELRKKNHGKGGLSSQQAKSEGVGSGVARARDIIDRDNLSPSTVKRMHAFFSRHNANIEKAKKLKGVEKQKSRAYIAALLWGGSAGKSWASKIVRQMQAADKKS